MNKGALHLGVCIAIVMWSVVARAEEAGAVRVLEEPGMEFVWCPPGEALIGSSVPGAEIAKTFGGHESWYGAEYPQRVKKIDSGFWMGRFEITRGQWKAVMGTTPWIIAKGQGECDTCPATGMNYQAWETFVEKLSASTGLEFRIPTEVEWEYASRGGTTDTFYFGEDIALLNDYGWWRINGESMVHPVGEKKPNNWGLFDVIGNAAEWTSTAHEAKVASDKVKLGAFRVVRGGNIASTEVALRHAWRISQREVMPNQAIGLRIVLVE